MHFIRCHLKMVHHPIAESEAYQIVSTHTARVQRVRVVGRGGRNVRRNRLILRLTLPSRSQSRSRRHATTPKRLPFKGACLFCLYLDGYLLMSGVFSVGGRLSRIVIRKTVIERRALMPSVTFSPDSDGT